jgi:hypothetical protein
MPKVITDGIRAVAFLMTDAGAQQMVSEISEIVKTQIQEQMETFNVNVEMMRDAVEHITNAARDITTKIDEIKDGLGKSTDHITEVTQELKNTTHELIEKTAGNNATPHTITAQPATTTYNTYTTVAQQNMPTALATIVTRGETSNKQMLIQTNPNNTDNALNSLTEKELVTKANTALDLMGIEATDRPTDTTFIGAKKLRNGNILYQLNTQEAVNWFKLPDVKRAFTAKFDSTSNIQNKLFYIIAEFIPTTFEEGSSFTHARIESDSTLAENTIAYSKYIKPAHLRTAGQKVAHVVFGFSDHNDTNKAIEYGMYIEGEETKV